MSNLSVFIMVLSTFIIGVFLHKRFPEEAEVIAVFAFLCLLVVIVLRIGIAIGGAS